MAHSPRWAHSKEEQQKRLPMNRLGTQLSIEHIAAIISPSASSFTELKI